jgi:hypothetical protein
MKINYLPTFIKDIKSLKSTSSYSVIKSLVFTDILAVQNFKEISNLKKLKGDDNAYRKIPPIRPNLIENITG